MQIQGIFWVTSTAIIGINMRSTGTKKIAKMSKNAGDFSIPGRNFFHEDMGTLQAPKIVKITFGERFEKSLIFHCKVGSNFYCYRLVEVNSRTVNLICRNHQKSLKTKKKREGGCLARAKISIVKDGLIQKRATQILKDGHERNKFSLNFADDRILDPESYTVGNYDSQLHNVFSKETFFTGLKQNFRHLHVQAGLQKKSRNMPKQ